MGIFSGVLIVSDLDGTLTDSKGKISEENRAAVRSFCERGGWFSLSTSRPLHTFENILGFAPFNAPIVHASGSLIYDHARKTAVFADYLDDTALAICREVRELFPDVCLELYNDTDAYVVNVSSKTRSYHKHTGTSDIYVDLPELAPGPWIKVALTCDDRATLLELQKYLERTYTENKYIFSSPNYLEILQHGVDKGFGALRLASHLGVSRNDLYTVGNYDNDADMLEVAAISFAPRNSVEALLKVADVLLPDNDSHPFVAMIEYLERIYGVK